MSTAFNRIFRFVRLISLLAMLTIFCSACASQSSIAPLATATPKTPTPTPAPTKNAFVTIGSQAIAEAVSPDFVGFSIEPGHLCELLDLERHSSTLVHLYENLHPEIIRIGGTSQDSAKWSPDQPCSGLTFGKSTIINLFNFAQQVNARVIWGVNLRTASLADIADEAHTVVALGGARVLGLELGNEPNKWTKETEASYQRLWEAAAAAIVKKTPGAPLVGPGLSFFYPPTSWFTQFVKAERIRLVRVTYHAYPLAYNAPPGSNKYPSISNLLSAGVMSRLSTGLSAAVSITNANHLPLVIEESNTMAGGNLPSVSDAFADSLWVADFLFTAAEHNVRAVEIHGNGGASSNDASSPLELDTSTKTPYARPIYYGMLLFHTAVGSGGTPLQAQVTSQVNLAVHALVNTNGNVQVVFINKDQHYAAQTSVTLGGTAVYGKAHAITLVAPSVYTTRNIKLGGASVASDGSWHTQNVETIPLNGKSFALTIPPASAILVTLVRSAQLAQLAQKHSAGYEFPLAGPDKDIDVRTKSFLK